MTKITTAEELDALPVGSVVRDADRRAYVVKVGAKGIRGVLRVDGVGIDTALIGDARNLTYPAHAVYVPEPTTATQ